MYARAAQLNPTDLMLHDQRLELLRKEQRDQELAAATMQFVELLLTMGVADRARASLKSALDVPALKYDGQLLERLAEVEARLGHGDAAGEIYLRLAHQLPRKDDEGRLQYLKRAFDYRPEDTTLRQRIEDIVSGQLELRRKRRRRLVAWTAGLLTLLERDDNFSGCHFGGQRAARGGTAGRTAVCEI